MGKQHAFRIGARTLKSALAVFLCLLFDTFITKNSNFYSAFAAILCMTPTSEESIVVGANRTIGTAFSGIASAAVLAIYNFLPQYQQMIKLLIIPLFIVLIIEFFVLVGRPQAIGISSAIFLAISLGPMVSLSDLAQYIIIRVFETVVGIVIGTLVNHFIFPYADKKEEEGTKHH